MVDENVNPNENNDSNDTTTAGSTETPPQKPQLTPDEEMALFDAYAKLDADYNEIKAGLEDVAKERSAAAKAILDNLGSGPFQYKGAEISISRRGDNYFVRGKQAKAVRVIGG